MREGLRLIKGATRSLKHVISSKGLPASRNLFRIITVFNKEMKKMDDNQLKQAKRAYKTLCEMLDAEKWVYDKNEEKMSISTTAHGDGLNIDVRMHIDAERYLAVFYSTLPFTVPQKRRAAVAVAVGQINHCICNGSFDFKYADGTVVFRITSSYRDSLVGKEFFKYLLFCACGTVDDYTNKLMVVANNEASNDEVVKYIIK